MTVPQHLLSGRNMLGEFVQSSWFVILSKRSASKDLRTDLTTAVNGVRRSFGFTINLGHATMRLTNLDLDVNDMVLANEKCCVEITIDTTYTVDSTDNRYYDVVLNPCHYKRSDRSKTFSIHIDLFERAFRIALIGPFYAYDDNCAVLDDETVTVLQGNAITQLRITDGTMIRHTELDGFGCNFAIYKVETGYILHGEIEITMLAPDLIKKWSFAGKDIFASVTGKCPFEIRNHSICLYDFEDNYYEVDFDGNLLW